MTQITTTKNPPPYTSNPIKNISKSENFSSQHSEKKNEKISVHIFFRSLGTHKKASKWILFIISCLQLRSLFIITHVYHMRIKRHLNPLCCVLCCVCRCGALTRRRLRLTPERGERKKNCIVGWCVVGFEGEGERMWGEFQTFYIKTKSKFF
jgi:hypothetical protein